MGKVDQKTKQKSSVPSLEKALDILELLAGEPAGLTMNQIVQVLGRTMGEIYRVTVYLHERGYVAQDPDTARYSLTLKLFALSHKHDPVERLLQRGLPLLERVAQTTEQSCHLSVINADQVLILASVASPRPAGYAVRTGAVFPIGDTSSGNVILAYSNDSIVGPQLAALTPAARKRVHERHAQIRERGLEDCASSMISGVRNLSVPVFDQHGIVAAMTIGHIAQIAPTLTPEACLLELRAAALELSNTLGGGALARTTIVEMETS